jgi:hypothetical protein
MPFASLGVPVTQPSIAVAPKARSSPLLLLATHFDIGVLRALFSPSWLTDGYLWCLEYLHQRLIDLSDQILSTALVNGALPIDLLRWRSLSMPNVNALNEHNYHDYMKIRCVNEQRTAAIIERQHWAMEKDNDTGKPPTGNGKTGLQRQRPGQRYTSFYRKIRYGDRDVEDCG